MLQTTTSLLVVSDPFGHSYSHAGALRDHSATSMLIKLALNQSLASCIAIKNLDFQSAEIRSMRTSRHFRDLGVASELLTKLVIQHTQFVISAIHCALALIGMAYVLLRRYKCLPLEPNWAGF
ncbi:GNAT family N-acetyltransferase [Alteromonas oceanisediminis]|uniref:GNAT family N-acetyltransferase n=1 Tax=Alteromonas oceanisediminis TaxID=2836180 RepID=UPI0036F1C7A0